MTSHCCKVCQKLISKYYKLCDTCTFDPLVTISYSDTKRKFGLTDLDIYSTNLFTIKFSTTLYDGTKYLVSEIIELGEKVVKDLDPSNKKRIKFLKYKEQINNLKVERQDMVNRRNILL